MSVGGSGQTSPFASLAGEAAPINHTRGAFSGGAPQQSPQSGKGSMGLPQPQQPPGPPPGPPPGGGEWVGLHDQSNQQSGGFPSGMPQQPAGSQLNPAFNNPYQQSPQSGKGSVGQPQPQSQWGQQQGQFPFPQPQSWSPPQRQQMPWMNPQQG